MIAQHNLLNDVADLIDKGVLRTTLDQTFGTINAANLKRAHALLESGKFARQGRAGGMVTAHGAFPHLERLQGHGALSSKPEKFDDPCRRDGARVRAVLNICS